MFTPRLKHYTDGAVATAFFPDNQLGQEADQHGVAAGVSLIKKGLLF